jgi:hypothetical protein
MFAAPASHAHHEALPPATPATPEVTKSGTKALTPGAETVFADFAAARWRRLPFSEEEIQTINSGTNEVGDWRKVKL